MIVKGWSNGNPNNVSGSGYGIKLSKEDRDKYFKESWQSVKIRINRDEPFEVNISKSFWGRCIELRSYKIGKLLLNKRLAPWKKYHPPRLRLEKIKDKNFYLRPI